MSSTIQVKLDDDLRTKSDNPYNAMSEDELLKKLETSRKHAEQGLYRDADDVIADVRTKYGL
jgi:hypothetical protein